jgi:hypothetical protein
MTSSRLKEPYSSRANLEKHKEKSRRAKKRKKEVKISTFHVLLSLGRIPYLYNK